MSRDEGDRPSYGHERGSQNDRYQGDRYKDNVKCHRCGQEGHMAKNCPFVEEQGDSRNCFNCGQPGHLSRDCPGERKQNNDRRSRSNYEEENNNNYSEGENDSERLVQPITPRI